MKSPVKSYEVTKVTKVIIFILFCFEQSIVYIYTAVDSYYV